MAKRRNALVILLECVPPLFHVALVSSLAFFILLFRWWCPSPSGSSEEEERPSPAWLWATLVVVAQIVGNWAQFLRHSSAVPVSGKNFPGYVHRFPSLSSSKDPREVNSDYEALRATWKECEYCDMHVPLLSQHCSHCRKCIYALDHHCYFLGQCIGRRNQRYFVVFCLYAALGSALGVSNLWGVMSGYRDPGSSELAYFLLPFTTVMYFAGKVQPFELLYVGLIDFGVGAFSICTFYFLHSLHLILNGDPRHEESVERHRKSNAKVRYDDEKVMTPCERWRLVFGQHCWPLQFLLPVSLVGGPPALETGYRRIVTYNNDYILNGMVRSSQELLA